MARVCRLSSWPRTIAGCWCCLKVEPPQPLTVPELTPEKEVRIGQWSIAVGRTFELPQPNVSIGIVSAVRRMWGKAIQTDAKISPNNYGGPLVDLRGRVLGVLVPLSPQGTTAVAGVGMVRFGHRLRHSLGACPADAAALERGRPAPWRDGRELQGGPPVCRSGDHHRLPREFAGLQGGPASRATRSSRSRARASCGKRR